MKELKYSFPPPSAPLMPLYIGTGSLEKYNTQTLEAILHQTSKTLSHHRNRHLSAMQFEEMKSISLQVATRISNRWLCK